MFLIEALPLHLLRIVAVAAVAVVLLSWFTHNPHESLEGVHHSLKHAILSKRSEVDNLVTNISIGGHRSNQRRYSHAANEKRAYPAKLHSRYEPAVKGATSSYSGRIVMDWITDSDHFGFMNYKSLESLLIVYPKAEIVIHLIAPNGAEYYKIGNLISKHYFQKYLKMGYRVSVKVKYMNIKDRHDGRVLPYGSNYWNEEFRKCCDYTAATDIHRRRAIPLHLLFYRRFLTLFARGGMYSDFSWYHRRPLEMKTGASGAVIQEVCRSKSAAQPFSSSSVSEQRCFTSTLMMFGKGDPVLNCMLELYDRNTSSFRNCITATADYETGSADCIKTSLFDCFEQEQQSNEFFRVDLRDTPFQTQHHLHTLGQPICGSIDETLFEQGKWGDTQSSKLMEITNATTVIRDCAMLQQTLLQICSMTPSAHNLLRLPTVVNAVDMCGISLAMQKHDTAPVEQQYHHVFYNWDVSERILIQQHKQDVVDGSRGDNRSFSIDAVLNSALRSEVLWIGSWAAYSDQWVKPLHQSIFGYILAQHQLPLLYPEHNSSLMFYNTTTTGRLRRENLIFLTDEQQRELETVEHRPAPGWFDSSNERAYILRNAPSVGGSDRIVAVQQPTCHRYKFSHSDVTGPLQRQADSSCAPHFIIAGFMKAGTTALFGSIATHPQVVNNLRGVSFKETGCYMSFQKKSFSNRMQCFPYVEQREHVYFGDGTVWYGTHWELPPMLLKDNPDIRVLFSIRDPVKRTESHHRFNFGTLQRFNVENLNVAIARAMNRSEGSLMELRDSAIDAADTPPHSRERQEKIAEFVRKFKLGARSAQQDNQAWRHCKVLLMNSIYFPAVYHWYHALPNKKHLFVARAEEYNPEVLNMSTKLAYLRTVLPSDDAVSALHAKHQLLREQARNMSNIYLQRRTLKRAEQIINQPYLIERLNTIHRFLGLVPVEKIGMYDVHATGEKKLLPEHKLTNESRQLLYEFYAPFNQLLEDFLRDHLGFIGGLNYNEQRHSTE